MSISFKDDIGYFWPDYDLHHKKSLDKVVSHICDINIPVSLCSHKKVVIQAGGHVGIWPEKLSSIFETVYTYEPDPDLFNCMKKNIGHIKNVKMFNMCLGEKSGEAFYSVNSVAGSGFVETVINAPFKCIPVIQKSIDDMFQECDAILLDVEGSELKIIEGAKKLIKKCKPVILLDRWNTKYKQQHDYMKSIDYVFYQKSGRDLVFIHKDML
jgi:FkbM family methyltransferase